MTARIQDLYDLNSPMITPAAPAAAPQRRTYWTRTANDRLFNYSVLLLICGGVVYLLGVTLSATPIGQVMPAENIWLWLGVIVAGLLLGIVLAAVLVATAKRVRA